MYDKNKAPILVKNQRRRKRVIENGGNLTLEEWLAIRNLSPICPMCGQFVGCESLTLDHIIPLCKGGRHEKENVQALCRSCNAKKGKTTPTI